MNTYLAWLTEEKDDKTFAHSLKELPKKPPADGEVAIDVQFSSLNYKDFLSLTGNKGVTKNYPHVPGIDAAGVVSESKSPLFKKGDRVIVTGYDLGMNTDGGLGQCIVVPAQWVVPFPGGKLDLEKAMAFGTAGFTAAQSVEKIVEHGIKKSDGPIAVSGASGGVGSVAVALLSHLGYDVVAFSRGKEADFLKQIGAKEVHDLNVLSDEKSKTRPLLKTSYAACVDTIGGDMLSCFLKSVNYRGIVTCCGMVAGVGFDASVFPFILRGVTLAGVDSAECPIELKKALWKKLAGDWFVGNLEKLYEVIDLKDAAKYLLMMKSGSTKARIVVKVS